MKSISHGFGFAFGVMIFAMVSLCVLLACGFGLVSIAVTNTDVYRDVSANINATVEAQTHPPAKPTPRSGEAYQNLGVQSFGYGSTNQAKSLLALMSAQPGKADYAIEYQTDAGNILFGANFDQDVILRLLETPEGHATKEIWTGYIMERLQAAAAGGSLNDTPAGKIPAAYETK